MTDQNINHALSALVGAAIFIMAAIGVMTYQPVEADQPGALEEISGRM